MSTVPIETRASVRIDAGRPRLPYDRMIFGHFIEHFHRQVYGGVFQPGSRLSDERGFRLDVIEAMRDLRAPVVRWPGGCFVSAYHWLDGVGPQRRPAYDRAWRVQELNTFGTAEFVEWCREVGAEPYICTNAGTGTPEEMADWVEYCNLADAGRWARLRAEHGQPVPFDVRWWSIGNENYGNWEIGAKSAGEWARYVVEAAKMMRRVDEELRIIVAGTPDLDWTLSLLREAGSHVDIVAVHGYWDVLHEINQPSDYLTCVGRSLEPEADIRRVEQLIAVAGLSGRVGIAFDEWNLRGWHHPVGNAPAKIAARDLNDDNSTYTMADAVFSAAFLNGCLRHAGSVRMANISPSVNTRGQLFVHPAGGVGRTTFHVLSMYANLLAPYVIDAHVEADPLAVGGHDVPVLDAIVTGDAQGGRLVAALTNRHPAQQVVCSVSAGDTPLDGEIEATVLRGDSPDAFNDVEHPDRVVPERVRLDVSSGELRLPPHSVTVVELPAEPATSASRRAWFSLGAAGWQRR
jgi:alpha-N-arabinofuranosidase